MEQKPNQTFRFFRKLFKGWNSVRAWFASALNVDVERKTNLYLDLSKSATLKDLVYWLQILFSAGIATLGLVLNSSAVIIGAMLISPLMAPILSAGLAFATGDLTLGLRSLANLFLSTLLGIGFAVFLVALLPFKNQTAEIMARTSPNTLDLVIALFSGAIGSIATCKEVKGVVTSIPGVAIAVALMPPLCVVGYGIGFAVSVDASEGWQIASGGGLLYLTNLVAITFTAMLVFVLLRVDRKEVREKVRDWRETDSESTWWMNQIDKIPALEKARQVRSFSLRLLMILLPLLIIFVPLSQSFSKLRNEISQKQQENRVSKIARDIWKDEYEVDSEGNIRSYLDELRVSEQDDKIQIFLRVFDNKPYTIGERKQYINLVAEELKRKPETISLQLIEIPTSQREEVQPIVENTPKPLTLAQRQRDYVESFNNSLTRFRLTPPATLIDYSIITSSNNASTLHINYLSNRDIDADGKSALQDRVRDLLNMPKVNLTYTRIPADNIKITFNNDSKSIKEDTISSLVGVGGTLSIHPSLKLRVMLKPDTDEEKSFEEKKKIIQQYFKETHSVDESKLVFGELSSSESDEMCQYFVRK